MSLTKHSEGSMRELWTISFPLMLSALSVMMMLFVDRLFLAQYSLEAFNAVIEASTLGWAFLIGAIVLANISEVFVAQYNGAGLKEKIGEPVWQMIWLSLGMFFLFLPLSQFGGYWFFGTSAQTEMQRQYFGWMMLFGPSFPMYGALSGFFVGRGNVKVITWLAIGANFVNAILDWIMIFGIPHLFPSLGITGAAIATCTSQIFQLGVLFYLFLKKENRSEFSTGCIGIRWKSMLQCIRFGSPAAMFIALELFGWAIYYQLMTHTSEKHITIAGIWQSLIILLWFVNEGLQKGVTTIVGNLIGAKKTHLIPSTIFSGIKILLIYFIFVLSGMFLFHETIATLFLNSSENYKDALPFCLITVAFYILFEGIRFLFSGALTAAGDTLFLLASGCVMMWLFLITPIYYAVVKVGVTIETASIICVVYAALTVLVNFMRFLQGKWKTIVITA